MLRPRFGVDGLRTTGHPSTYSTVCVPSFTTATCHQAPSGNSCPQFVSDPSWLVGYTHHCSSRSPDRLSVIAGSSGSPSAPVAFPTWPALEYCDSRALNPFVLGSNVVGSAKNASTV